MVEQGGQRGFELPRVDYHFPPVLPLVDGHQVECVVVLLPLHYSKNTRSKDLLFKEVIALS